MSFFISNFSTSNNELKRILDPTLTEKDLQQLSSTSQWVVLIRSSPGRLKILENPPEPVRFLNIDNDHCNEKQKMGETMGDRLDNIQPKIVAVFPQTTLVPSGNLVPGDLLEEGDQIRCSSNFALSESDKEEPFAGGGSSEDEEYIPPLSYSNVSMTQSCKKCLFPEGTLHFL